MSWISPMKKIQSIFRSSACQNEAQYIATDLDSYEQYAMINTLEDLLSSMKLKETKIDTPDFIQNQSQSVTAKTGIIR